MPRGRRIVGVLATVLLVAVLWWMDSADDVEPDTTASSGSASTTQRDQGPSGAATDPASGFAWVDEADLPSEAQDVLSRIDAGGPFKYPEHDGKTFGNFEGLLPDRPRGYYREYTVEIRPDVRGPLRIVTGADDEAYWTEDHYASFARIRR